MKKTLYIALFGIFAAAVLRAATLPDATLTGDSKVPNHAELTVKTGGSLTIEGGAAITANAGAFINGFDIKPARFAVFQLPLGIYGVKDFEIKGTLDNFDRSLVFFYGSQYGSDSVGHGMVGPSPAVYYTDSGHGHEGGKKWRVKGETQSIYEQATPGGIVGGVIVVIPVTDIISPDNPNLIFIWETVSATGLGNVWVPIVPQWMHKAPTP